MKLEKNMYVRTKYGEIGKIEELYHQDSYEHSVRMKINGYYDSYLLKEIDFEKASENIIDILEVGDYVNGEKVIALEKDVDKRNIYPSNAGAKIFTDYEIQGDWYFGIQEEDIKSIVTSQQFENMSYKIGD